MASKINCRYCSPSSPIIPYGAPGQTFSVLSAEIHKIKKLSAVNQSIEISRKNSFL